MINREGIINPHLTLSLKQVLENNRHLTVDNFEDVEEPDLAGDDPNTSLPRFEEQGRADPEYKGSVESLGREDKHIILETGDDDLVECTLQWLRMCNKNVQKKVMDRVVKTVVKIVICIAVVDIGQTGCEVKKNHKVGKTGLTSPGKTGMSHFCCMSVI